jgi:mannose-1-phosphate guanylyltransferase/phosphomannomutase
LYAITGTSRNIASLIVDGSLSKYVGTINNFEELAYIKESVPCQNALRGLMMRKFLEDSETKRSSMKDGIKIWLDKSSWVLMIPDQYSDFLNLYIQSNSQEKAQDILDSYKDKIINWSNRKNMDQLLVEHV